jgi:hypothetical protein
MTMPTTIALGRATHPAPPAGQPPADGQACIMELVSYLAGEPWSDAPDCVSSVIRRFLVGINDHIADDATRTALLLPYAHRVIGTAGTREQEVTRAYICADWAVRTIAPLALEAAGLADEAARLRALPPAIDPATTAAVAAAASAAYAAAYAAADAYAAAAAYAAACAAAYADDADAYADDADDADDADAYADDADDDAAAAAYADAADAAAATFVAAAAACAADTYANADAVGVADLPRAMAVLLDRLIAVQEA